VLEEVCITNEMDRIISIVVSGNKTELAITLNRSMMGRLELSDCRPETRKSS